MFRERLVLSDVEIDKVDDGVGALRVIECHAIEKDTLEGADDAIAS